MRKIFDVRILILILLPVFLYSFYQQSPTGEQIYWAEHKNLTWGDYLAKPDMKDTNNSALTYYGISCSMKTKGDSISFFVRSIFDKSKSWVKTDDKTDSLLLHEQGHFDIAEIYSRILKKTLNESHPKKATIGADFNEFYKSNIANLNAEQGLYDEETNHGRIPSKQKEWNEKIKNRLEEHEQFSKDKLTMWLVR